MKYYIYKIEASNIVFLNDKVYATEDLPNRENISFAHSTLFDEEYTRLKFVERKLLGGELRVNRYQLIYGRGRGWSSLVRSCARTNEEMIVGIGNTIRLLKRGS